MRPALPEEPAVVRVTAYPEGNSMTRKILVAAALFASTAYVVACGGDKAEGAGANTPKPEVSSAAPEVKSAEPAMSSAPAPSATPEPPKVKTPFEKLGGKDGITKAVDAIIKKIGDDKRINKYFAKTVKDPKKLEALKANLVDQITAAVGGPAEYKGKDMVAAHKGMNLKEADFTAFVEDVAAGLKDAGVADEDAKPILDTLNGMKDQVVDNGKKAPKPATSAAASTSAKPKGK